MMKKIETGLQDCYIIEPDKFGDDRGYFSPYFIQKSLNDLDNIKYDEEALSKIGQLEKEIENMEDNEKDYIEKYIESEVN